MKKIIVFLFLVIFLSSCAKEKIIYNKSGNSAKGKAIAEDFNNSGRAKAIENETDLWKLFEDNESGLSLKYPYNVSLNGDSDLNYELEIFIDEIDGLEGTLGFDEQTALANEKSLASGEYGDDVDFPLVTSKKVKQLGGFNAQEYMVLSRFEVCSVVFERSLLFYKDGKQFRLNLIAPQSLKEDLQVIDYFEKNSENCGDDLIWNYEKQEEFYNDLKLNKLSGSLQEWFNIFDKIVSTIEFYDEVAGEMAEEDYISLEGEWQSLDDENSTIKFSGNEKIDFYKGELINRKDYKRVMSVNDLEENESGVGIIVGNGTEMEKYVILELSRDKLVISLYPRGNTLKYYR